MRIAQSDEIQEASHDWVSQGVVQLSWSVVVAVYVAPNLRLSEEIEVVCSSEQSHVIDLGNAGHEELDSAGEQVFVSLPP